ncbi:MAG: DUF1631 family protein [Rhizobacter sp.]
MATTADSLALAAQARRSYVERLLSGVPGVVHAVEDGARLLATQSAEHGLQYKRRDVAVDLRKAAPTWINGIVAALRGSLGNGMVVPSRPGDLMPAGGGRSPGMSLVDDDTIEVEILSSRLALAMMDRASWEFTDLRSRMSSLEQRDELDTHDVLRPHVLARIVTTTWRSAGMGQEAWRVLQGVLHEELAHFAEEAYHETNRWLIQQRVLPEIDLRPFIRRARAAGIGGGGGPALVNAPPSGASSTFARTNVGEETRLMTRAGGFARGSDHAEAVLGRLNRLIGRQLPDFAGTAPMPPASAELKHAIADAQQGIQRRLSAGQAAGEAVSTPALMDELHQRKQALKSAATSPVERATIEIVALLFQSILTEDRIPASVRVWFARLQMPVLRVAVGEPDFFATIDHPARRLIDRMGACVMGFDSGGSGVSGQPNEALEKEIKRIVQVVEAYPDTGRRVFQTVLTEFEKFLEHYFSTTNEATKRGVSLAQQVEQRETLAIQYTIELRRMLNEVPVQEGVRQFLFHVWADVLATTAVRFGAQGNQTKTMKRAAADLIWSASAKVTREERAEVIRRLPLLLKSLREGMASAGMDAPRQDEQIQQLNNSLAAAFTAKAAVIPDDRLRELMERLETLEELLPEQADVDIDESMVLDLSGHQNSELDVVLEGGSMPTPAMVAWARELQVGSWYMLDRNGRTEAVQLAWHGMRKQLSLFVTPQGRCVLFQQHRLASYLQAGLMLPAQDESLTVRATRSALAKLDVDVSRLLH